MGINGKGDQTSIKGLFQGLLPEGEELMQGTVIQVSPLKIQMDNDQKLILNERIIIVPWHLTNYKQKATLKLKDGSIDASTNNVDAHSHKLTTFSLVEGEITVFNALKKGEKVHVMALNNGKLYYVLDRVVS